MKKLFNPMASWLLNFGCLVGELVVLKILATLYEGDSTAVSNLSFLFYFLFTVSFLFGLISVVFQLFADKHKKPALVWAFLLIVNVVLFWLVTKLQ